MKNLFQALLTSTMVAVGAGVMASAPASAASLTNIGTGATADILTYCSDGATTYECDADLATVLTGDASNPGGNIELASDSEQAGFDFSTSASMRGTLNGKAIGVSSLTASDWATDMGGVTLAQKWFSEAMGVVASQVDATTQRYLASQQSTLFGIFSATGGFQRFSDPNISYINQDDSTGEVKIGLAGHYNATPLVLGAALQYLGATPQGAALGAALSGVTLQASELVKVVYDGGPAQFLYSFAATESGQYESGDGISHTGNYEVAFQGQLPPGESVPEPAALLGLVSVGGLMVRRRQAKRA
jgi:hypothetical protein